MPWITFILVCQLIGELTARSLAILVPGPVVGMVLLFVYLLISGSVPENLGKVADGLLANLSLLFVPAGVGVMLHFQLLGNEWLPLGAALVSSTLLTVAVTALLMRWLDR